MRFTRKDPTMDIGILGAGEIGGTLAGLFARAGHRVMVSSRHPESLAEAAASGGYRTGTVDEACRFGELIIAALPFNALGVIPPAPLAGKVVLDTMNYYPARDGAIREMDAHETTTSQIVAARLPGARIVKAFNAILSYDLPLDGRPPITSGRRALPIAGEDADAKAIAADLHDQIEFDVVDAGGLAESWRFERAKPAYCIPFNAEELRAALAAADRDSELPHGSWRRQPRVGP